MQDSGMILVTGATGHLGSSVVKHLQQHLALDQFAVLARNLAKAQPYIEQDIEVRFGDFNKPRSLIQAFQGIDKLLLISTMEMNRLEQHQDVVDAAKEAGVKHIIYTSLAIQNIASSAVKDLMLSHFETEDYIRASGLNYTFLRNTMYAEAIPQIIGERVLETGIHLSDGTGKVPYALRAELGEATANVLLQEGHENKYYELTGSKSYSYADISNLLSEIKGEKVSYENIDLPSYTDLLKSQDLPEFIIYLTQGTVLDIQAQQYEVESTDLAQLLGRQTADLKEYLHSIYH